ncbi:MAG: hypothetical protein ATN31_10725 [Candidatus Epulonipiscioides saccharophilum]|nr:MAG: hypothetical protein ATN31_10725 [Epulopiscium sp. AS2M-Bin001]
MSNQQSNTLDLLVNAKVVVYTGHYSYCVIISEICQTNIKAIEFGTGQARTFNLADVDYIEYILP